MAKFPAKGSPEAKNWAAKMKAAREAKKAGKPTSPEVQPVPVTTPVVPVEAEAKPDNRYEGIEVKPAEDVFRGATVVFDESQTGIKTHTLDGKKQKVFYCSINGRKYYFPVGKQVDVPREVLSLLVDIKHPAARSLM